MIISAGHSRDDVDFRAHAHQTHGIVDWVAKVFIGVQTLRQMAAETRAWEESRAHRGASAGKERSS